MAARRQRARGRRAGGRCGRARGATVCRCWSSGPVRRWRGTDEWLDGIDAQDHRGAADCRPAARPRCGSSSTQSCAARCADRRRRGSTFNSGRDQLEPFYAVFAQHMRDLGTPAQPRRLFEAIAAASPDDVWFGCAYLGEQAGRGRVRISWQSEFEMTWASASSRTSARANMLLYWAFMERAAARGCAFNFGRCTPGAARTSSSCNGARATSSSAGTTGTRRARRRLRETPSPDDAAYAWGPRLWKRLPLPLATALGPRIVKYIP